TARAARERHRLAGRRFLLHPQAPDPPRRRRPGRADAGRNPATADERRPDTALRPGPPVLAVRGDEPSRRGPVALGRGGLLPPGARAGEKAGEMAGAGRLPALRGPHGATGARHGRLTPAGPPGGGPVARGDPGGYSPQYPRRDAVEPGAGGP